MFPLSAACLCHTEKAHCLANVLDCLFRKQPAAPFLAASSTPRTGCRYWNSPPVSFPISTETIWLISWEQTDSEPGRETALTSPRGSCSCTWLQFELTIPVGLFVCWVGWLGGFFTLSLPRSLLNVLHLSPTLYKMSSFENSYLLRQNQSWLPSTCHSARYKNARTSYDQPTLGEV